MIGDCFCFGNRALHVCYGFLVYWLCFMNIVIISFVLVRPCVVFGMTTQQAHQSKLGRHIKKDAIASSITVVFKGARLWDNACL